MNNIRRMESGVERMEEAVGAKGKGLMEEKERYLEDIYVARSASGHIRIKNWTRYGNFE